MAQRADLLTSDQITDGPPESLAQGIVRYGGLPNLGVRIELILPVCTENLCSGVMVMKSAQDGA